MRWFSAVEDYGREWGLPILMLHFSCNLGIFTLFLQSPIPHGHPLPKPSGVALKQSLETTDLQDHLPVCVCVCVREERFVNG